MSKVFEYPNLLETFVKIAAWIIASKEKISSKNCTLKQLKKEGESRKVGYFFSQFTHF